MPGVALLRPLAAASSKAARESGSRTGTAASKVEKKMDENFKLLSRPHMAARNIVKGPVHAGAVVRASQAQATAAATQAGKMKPADSGADALRARLFSTREVRDTQRAQQQYMSSSGSEHEPSSACLAAMVHDFMQEDGTAKLGTKCGRPRCNCENGVCDGVSSTSEDDDSKSVLGKELTDLVQSLAPCVTPLEKSLLLDTTQSLAKVREVVHFACKDGGERCTNCIRRLVIGELRRRGYNAAICKSRWDHAGGYPGGDYEYIDVVVEDMKGAKEERLLVDIDFRAQFEIARPTNGYLATLNTLPSIFVGKADRIYQLVKVMSDAARRSLKKRGLYLPPWRKPEYMRAKWLSAYRRTTNPIPPQHLAVDRNLNRDIGSLAVRDHGWDEKFRNAMESHFHKEGTTDGALKELERNAEFHVPKPVRSGLIAELKGTAYHTEEGENAGEIIWKVQAKEAELEGRVRGANRMLFTKVENDTTFISGLGKEIQFGDNNQWQLPAVKPRSPHRIKIVAGLATMLKEAKLHQEQ